MRRKRTARMAGRRLAVSLACCMALWQALWLSSCGAAPQEESGRLPPEENSTAAWHAAVSGDGPPAAAAESTAVPPSSAPKTEEKAAAAPVSPTIRWEQGTASLQTAGGTGQTTGTTSRNHSMDSVMILPSLAAYEATLRTLSTAQALEQAFLESALYGRYVLKEEEFAMQLAERYFLLPVLPAGCTVTAIWLCGWGTSEFSITLPDGADVLLIYRHHQQEFGVSDDAVRTTFSNARGLPVTQDHVRYASGEEAGDFTWEEDGYPCRLSYAGPARASYAAFVRALSFQAVPLA